MTEEEIKIVRQNDKIFQYIQSIYYDAGTLYNNILDPTDNKRMEELIVKIMKKLCDLNNERYIELNEKHGYVDKEEIQRDFFKNWKQELEERNKIVNA